MSSEDVPRGTVAQVLEWVGDDSQRAQRALDVEQAEQNRSTLINQLQAIVDCAPEEDSVSSTPDQTTDQTTETSQPDPTGPGGAAGTGDVGGTTGTTHDPYGGNEDVEPDPELDEETGLAPGPEQPLEVTIHPDDPGSVFLGLSVRDADVEAEPVLAPEPVEPEEREEDYVNPIEGEQVEVLEAVAAPHGLALALNGTVFLFGSQSVGQLKQIVDKTVVGLGL